MRKTALFVSVALVFFGVVSYGRELAQGPDDVIDVLSYIVGDAQRWARSGSHQMNQIVRGNSVTFVKFADPDWWERWTWDDEYIYHYEDHSASDPYVFSDGRWAKRFMTVGEELYFYSNTLQFYARSDCSPSYTWPFAYEMQLVAHYDRYNAGGSIGVADVIVLKYDATISQTNRGGDYELFFFAKGWGWFMWESWRYNGNTLSSRSIFNQIGGQPMRPNQGCRAHEAFPPGPQSLQPEIYSLRPNQIERGETLTISGKDLTDRVQFIDSSNRITSFGPNDGVRVIGDRSQVYIRVSAYLSPGAWRARVTLEPFSDRVSNSQDITILGIVPIIDQLPIGVLDVANCSLIGGWAFDPDTPNASIDVHIYKDNPGAPGSFVTALNTSGLRPDVNAAYGIAGYHGFTLATPASLKDGRTHQIYVYGINDKRNDQNPLLKNSPLPLSCSAVQK